MNTPILSAELDRALLLAACSLARIVPTCFFLPIFGEKSVGRGILAGVLAGLLAMGLMPVIDITAFDPRAPGFFIALAREAILGLFLGLALGAPWFAMQACGEIIDNQRGATMANAIDPASGIEASPLASWLSFMWTGLFLAGGGMRRVLSVLANSYQNAPLGTDLSIRWESVLTVVRMFTHATVTGILIACPAITAMILTDALLGILSRFAPQLNAFSLSLSLKSLVAALLLVLYLGSDMFDQVDALLDGPWLQQLVGPFEMHP